MSENNSTEAVRQKDEELASTNSEPAPTDDNPAEETSPSSTGERRHNDPYTSGQDFAASEGAEKNGDESKPLTSVFSPNRSGTSSGSAFKSSFTLNDNAVNAKEFNGNNNGNYEGGYSSFGYGYGWPPGPPGPYSSMMMPGMGPGFGPQLGVAAVGGAMVMLPDGTVIPNPAMTAMNGEASATHLAHLEEEEGVYQRLCEQIEYYFTPENVMKDEFLSQHMSPTGFAPLDVVADFKKVKKLSKDLSVVVASVHRSSKLILRPDWEGRYWAGLYPAVCERSRCTVILLNVDEDATKEDLQALIPDLKPYHVHRFRSGTVWYFTFPDAQLARQALFTMQAEAKRRMPKVAVRIRTDNIDRGYGDHDEGPSFSNTPSVNGTNPLPGGLIMQSAQASVSQSAAAAQGVAGEGLYASGGGGRGRGGGRGGGFPPNSKELEDNRLPDGKPRPPQAVIAPDEEETDAASKNKKKGEPAFERQTGGKSGGPNYSWADEDGDLDALPVQQLVEGSCGEVMTMTSPTTKGKEENFAKAAEVPKGSTTTAGGLPLALAVDEEEISNFKADAAQDVLQMNTLKRTGFTGQPYYGRAPPPGGFNNRAKFNPAARGGKFPPQQPLGRGNGAAPHPHHNNGGAPHPHHHQKVPMNVGNNNLKSQQDPDAPTRPQDGPGKPNNNTSTRGPQTGRGRGRGGHHQTNGDKVEKSLPPPPPKFEASDFPDLDGGAEAGSSPPAPADPVVAAEGAPKILSGWAAAVKVKPAVVAPSSETPALESAPAEEKQKDTKKKDNKKETAKESQKESPKTDKEGKHNNSKQEHQAKETSKAPIALDTKKDESNEEEENQDGKNRVAAKIKPQESKTPAETSKRAGTPPTADEEGSNTSTGKSSDESAGGVTASPPVEDRNLSYAERIRLKLSQ